MPNERFIIWGSEDAPDKELFVKVLPDNGDRYGSFLEFRVKDGDTYETEIGVAPHHAEEFLNWLVEQQPLWADKVEEWHENVAIHGEHAEVT